MNQVRYSQNGNILILSKVVLVLMIFGLFTIDNQGVLNMTSLLAVVLSIYYIKANEIDIKNIVLDLMQKRKLLLLFTLWCVFCIVFFTYEDKSLDAFIILIKDWRYPLVMMLFFGAFSKHITSLRQVFVIGAILTLSYIVLVVPILRIIKNNPQELYLQLRYGFAFYVVMLFPFVLTGAILFKNHFLKTVLYIISALAFVFLSYTGSRAGILAVVVEIFLISFLVSKTIKRFMAATCGLLFIMAALLIGAYNTVGQVKMKVDQTLQMNNVTSSRDEIILDRFPLVMENINNAIFGIGYGNSTYNQYLEDHNAPKNGGVYSERNNGYNIDEPFFMIILYNVGAIGLFLFTAAFFITFKDIYIRARSQKDIFSISLLCSLVGYILVYCLFEKMFINVFLLYSIAILMLYGKNEPGKITN
ncbi:O-antigen ligase family protein [Citrobacter sp. FDAARGOS_156]|uniref:O-antigen ligase family protein n=1 Tax=Citrobacter sp. FDAARGOS_156 TaxID=1702170 RepID=UPI0018FFC5A6|nr:O-antigen ligase family protein [Citrobacter sp. FDAARGOS_156]MBJ9113271.1 O-antigen ligase family protein [Citrobacter sp. FDAARGOS_156]